MNLHVAYSKKRDSDLWSDLKSGDRNAFSLIYENNIHALLDYALKFTREKEVIDDCAQELFFYLWTKREQLTDVQIIKNYLFTAFRRRLIKKLSKQRVIFNSDLVDIQHVFELPLESTMILAQEKAIQHERLHEAINSLSSFQKEVIYLKYFGNFSLDEISMLMDIEKKSLYNALSKAMIQLRNQLNPGLLLLLLSLHNA